MIGAACGFQRVGGGSAMVGTASLIAWYINVSRAAEPAPSPGPRRSWRVLPARACARPPSLAPARRRATR
jgi:hypothetical protein